MKVHSSKKGVIKMKEYEVQIKETLVMIVSVEAENAAHALEIAKNKWEDGEYILDADHFSGVTFSNHENGDC